MEYEKISDSESVKLQTVENQKILEIDSSVFRKLAEISFEEMRYFFPNLIWKIGKKF